MFPNLIYVHPRVTSAISKASESSRSFIYRGWERVKGIELVSLGKVLPGFGLPSNAEKGPKRFPISSPLVDDDLFQLAALVDDLGFENAVAGHVARGKEFLVADRLGDVAEWRQVPSRMVMFRKLVQLPGFIEF
jgi:hypothetical protein